MYCKIPTLGSVLGIEFNKQIDKMQYNTIITRPGVAGAQIDYQYTLAINT